MKKVYTVTSVGLVSVLLIGSGVFFLKWSNGPASTTKSTSSDGDVLSSQITLRSLETTYYKTQIPDTLQSKVNIENPRAPIMGNYLFKETNVSVSDQLAITVGKRGNETAPTLPAVQLRSSKPEEYRKATFNHMPDNAIGFESINGYEKAVYWVTNDTYNAVVVSGSPVRQSNLDQILNAVLANWQ